MNDPDTIRTYRVWDGMFELDNNIHIELTTPTNLNLPVKNSAVGYPINLDLDKDQAIAMMLYIARWLMTFNHVDSPLVVQWKED